MPRILAILEDDARRIEAMRTCLAALLPEIELAFFESAPAMIAWLSEHLREVVLISLDHDLPLRRDLDGGILDLGTGRQVVDFLVSIPPTCPVIVHSANDIGACGMYFAMNNANWPCTWVYPSDDVVWIKDSWAQQIRRYVETGWIARG